MLKATGSHLGLLGRRRRDGRDAGQRRRRLCLFRSLAAARGGGGLFRPLLLRLLLLLGSAVCQSLRRHGHGGRGLGLDIKFAAQALPVLCPGSRRLPCLLCSQAQAGAEAQAARDQPPSTALQRGGSNPLPAVPLLARTGTDANASCRGRLAGRHTQLRQLLVLVLVVLRLLLLGAPAAPPASS